MKHLLLTTIAAVLVVGCGPPSNPEADRALLDAAEKGNIEAVKLLLINNGADVNAKVTDGATPLDVAIRLKQTETADLLRKHGGKSGAEFSIQAAIAVGNIEAVKQHLAAGSDVNAKNSDDWTPLQIAADKGHKEIAELLIDKGADVNAKSGPFRETPLHNAASGGHKEIVELLIAAGADVSAKGLVFYGERTPLHRAAGQGHKGIAELLIVEGADLNAKDEWEYTPLHYAASEGHKVIVELLIAKGADVNVKSNVRGVNTNKTPLDWAIKQKHAETADLLRKHGGKTGEELKAEGK